MSKQTIEQIEAEVAEFADELGDEALDRTTAYGKLTHLMCSSRATPSGGEPG